MVMSANNLLITMLANVLNYALTLEHLEDKFYREALSNYTQADFVAAGFPDPFYSNLQQTAAEEVSSSLLYRLTQYKLTLLNIGNPRRFPDKRTECYWSSSGS